MKNRLYSFCFILLALLLSFLPFSFALVDQIGEFLVAIIISILICYILTKLRKTGTRDCYIILGIFLITFISRLLISFSLTPRMEQVSDFGVAYNASYNLGFGEYHRVFSHWLLYPIVNNWLYHIFGKTVWVSQVLNCFTVSVSAIFIYLITRKIVKNKNIAILASSLYICWPSIALYTVIFTPDHIASVLLLVITYLLISIYDKQNHYSWKRNILFATFIGMILAISTFFKNFGSVFLIAIFCLYLVELFKEDQSKKILKKVGIFIVMVICFFVVKEGIFRYLETYTHASIGRNIVPCYMNVGWRSTGNGVYNEKNYALYFNTLKKNDFDFDKTNQFVMKDLLKDMKKNVLHLPKLFLLKAKTNHNKDDSKLIFLTQSIKQKGISDVSIFIEKYMVSFTNLYYVIIMLGMVGGVFFNIKEKNKFVLYICICLFGVMLELLMVESQQRYRYGIEPFYCILAAFGYWNVSQLWKQKKATESLTIE